MATPPTPTEAPSTVHEATRDLGPSGAVEWGRLLTDQEAADRRRKGLDIVVRGPNPRANRAKARAIEAMVGPAQLDARHAKAGSLSLPHFHQVSRSPGGHSFYEDASGRKARRRQ